jgi:outer membrane protein insertion porin family
MLGVACKEEGTVTVHKLSFSGVKAVDESLIRKALATQTSSKLPWGRKRYFDRSRFDADLDRIRAFYADRGYPDARITAFDVKLNNKQDAVDVTLTISEGSPVTVAAVNFVGFDTIPPDHFQTMTTAVPLKKGQPRDRQQVVATQELGLNELRDHGFPYAKVSIDENDGASGKEAVLTFTAEPGKQAHFGPVEVSGNRSVSDRVIERELAYKPGDLYRRSLVRETQRRLYGMQLFQFASVEPLGVNEQPDDVPTRVTVAEGNHQRTNFGFGYGTEEKGRVDTEYHHLNFLGDARTAGAHARWSSLDRGVRLDFNQPYFFAPNVALGAQAQDWYTITPAYHSTIIGGKTTLTRKASAATSVSVSFTAERDTSTISPEVLADPTQRNALISLGFDPQTSQQNGTLAAVGFDLQRSTADNLLNASHGYQLALHIEQAGRFLPGTFNYWSVSGDTRHYLPLTSKIVWANRAQIGNIDPANGNPANVPFAKKYFLGGATSIRGWGRYEVSPLVDGLPVGGNSMFAFSSEMRVPLAGNFSSVLFLDAGNVWAGSWGIRFNDLLYAVGPGLRYQTPIGPVRFDVGYQLNRIPGLLVNGTEETRRWRIHFSIGQAF